MASTLHATLVFEREIPASAEKVFAALADPAERAKWGAPSPKTVFVYDETDFREGGLDRFHCGPVANPNIEGSVRYVDIVPNRRIVTCDTVTMEGTRLCASLTTLELTSEGEITHLKSTIQLASFIGEDMVKGHQSGNNASLDNLVQFFSKQ